MQMLNVNANMKKLGEGIIKEICDRVYKNLNILIAEVKNIPSEL